PPAMLSVMEIGSRSEQPAGKRYDQTDFDRAVEELWSALGDGLLAAHARDARTGQLVTIEAHEWASLSRYERAGPDPVYVAPGPLDDGYRAVRLRGAEVMAIWQPLGPVLDKLPVTVPPTGPGHLALYCAAQWIATA